MEDAARGTNRRQFLVAAGAGAAGAIALGGAAGRLGSLFAAEARADVTTLALAATDGYITMPGREDDPIYIFGFIPVDPGASVSDLSEHVQGTRAAHGAPSGLPPERRHPHHAHQPGAGAAA